MRVLGIRILCSMMYCLFLNDLTECLELFFKNNKKENYSSTLPRIINKVGDVNVFVLTIIFC